MDQYLAPALGSLLVLGMTVLISQLREINKSLTKQGETVVLLHTIIVGANGAPGLVHRVQELHDARSEEQSRELAELHHELAELREERRSGPADRRRA
jgi:hypothetical protein